MTSGEISGTSKFRIVYHQKKKREDKRRPILTLLFNRAF
jgi:hypothetical protein